MACSKLIILLLLIFLINNICINGDVPKKDTNRKDLSKLVTKNSITTTIEGKKRTNKLSTSPPSKDALARYAFNFIQNTQNTTGANLTNSTSTDNMAATAIVDVSTLGHFQAGN